MLDFRDGILIKRWLHGSRVDEPLAYEQYSATTAAGSGTSYEMYADRLGSILTVIEAATGTLAAEYIYDSFGNRTQTGSLTQRYGFTGREVDPESGLMYFRARHYDPALGQFLQRDPIGFAAGDLNLYAYVWNDPYNWTDPSGLMSGTDYTVLAAGTSLLTVGALCASGVCPDPSDFPDSQDMKDSIGSATIGLLGSLLGALGNIVFNDANGSGEGESGRDARPEPYIDGDGAEHILDGHQSGAGKPGKTEFPPDWDEGKILDAAEEIARNGKEVPHGSHNPNDIMYEGTVDGVDIDVIVEPGGRIITAIPTGGDGVIKNPW
ncbi:RHS repeat-associated core domain-containing protein [Parasulfitobacter algicola]|uniref:EndoU domain-containing protein n=1 Tax=Parasulfitobacter algicola TaxID=2614809 RepID=A0ABX2IWH2_9RHOB|nr:RHS repeat-associated core domain-containing protein [Sulfitobacter algicola]NSX56925.1 EndoU domain-containing protein [Sulfitobacter algicola]